MSVNALESLIRTCDNTNYTTTQAEEALLARQQKCPPIASLGFWAQNDVPLSVGPYSYGAKTATVERSEPTAQPMPLDEELKVRDRLAAAKEKAQVGDNIRWDVIIQEAARMPCGLKVGISGIAMKKANAADDFDRRSTSASGSGGGEVDEASSNDESDESGKEAASQILSTKLPPWRRGISTRDPPGADNDQPRSAAAAPPPWRRANAAKAGAPAADARVYSLTTMLAVYSMMQAASVVAIQTETHESEVSDSDEGEETAMTRTEEVEEDECEIAATDSKHAVAPQVHCIRGHR